MYTLASSFPDLPASCLALLATHIHLRFPLFFAFSLLVSLGLKPKRFVAGHEADRNTGFLLSGSVSREHDSYSTPLVLDTTCPRQCAPTRCRASSPPPSSWKRPGSTPAAPGGDVPGPLRNSTRGRVCVPTCVREAAHAPSSSCGSRNCRSFFLNVSSRTPSEACPE